MGLSTKSILMRLSGSPMQTFVANWDMLEELVTAVYNTGKVEPTDKHLFKSLQYALRDHYKEWADVLRPYWQQVKVAGRMLTEDPFNLMMEAPEVAGLAENWDMMQSLPAAREALNLLLQDMEPKK